MESKSTNEELIKRWKGSKGLPVKEGHFHPLTEGEYVPVTEEDIARLFLRDLIEKGFLSEELERLLTMDWPSHLGCNAPGKEAL